jgi:tol-pal system protein YbgF
MEQTMAKQSARNLLAVALAVGALAAAGAGHAVAQGAQQAPPQPMNAAPAAPAGKSKAKASAEAAPADGGVTRRVEQLEEQIVDMQVTVGTLESMSRSGGGTAPRVGNGSGGGGGASADAGRVDGLETQVRALAAEVQRLTTEVRRLSGASGQTRGDAGGPRFNSAEATPAAPPATVAAAPATTYIPPSIREPARTFGSTTVTPSGDPIGTLIEGAPRGGAGSVPAPIPPGETQVAAVAPAAATPKQDYEAAYGHLLRQDYGAAEAAFEDFLKNHGADPLAGNAQYWLGETHFVRGNYKPAAAAFLKGYQSYSKSNKAPDSLLKLAMSLDRLGQKDAACSSFGELVGKFPDAPSHVKSRAASEQKRLGCR